MTDLNLVNLQIDVYWMIQAGLDPVELLSRYSGMVPTLQAKEMSGKADRSNATAGDGITNWAAVLLVVDAAGTKC